MLKQKMTWDGVEYSVAPCPFCGKMDGLEVTPRDSYEELFAEYDGATLSIRCEDCYVEMYEHSIKTFNYHAKLALLVNKWNERRCCNGHCET